MSYLRKILFAITVFSLLPFAASADDLASQCLALSSNGCPAGTDATACKTMLQQCSDYYDQQSAAISKDITKTAQQKNTLANQISAIKKQIQNLDYQIKQGNVKIQGLHIQIEDTKVSIDKTDGAIDKSTDEIKNILQEIYQEDKTPLFAIFLQGNLSDFFSNLVHLEKLNEKVSLLLNDTKDLKDYLQTQQGKMDTEVDQLQKTVSLQLAQKAENDKNKKQQEQYLQMTEAQYQQQLKTQQDVQAKSAKIKALLFQLVGVTKTPTFGEALELAKPIANSIGIRPAFLLAILSQESAIGRNVGQCVLTDAKGNGKRISTGAVVPRVMNPTRDVPVFMKITASLGKDAFDTPVSCWITDYRKGVPYGWGGAMGPAQFIPSTWNLYANRLKSFLGRDGNPWSIQDAFAAAGLYLSDLGAGGKTMATEKSAASRYYGGSSSYANSVYNRASCIQDFVDNSTMSAYCQNLIF